jgi:hypothetical protein
MLGISSESCSSWRTGNEQEPLAMATTVLEVSPARPAQPHHWHKVVLFGSCSSQIVEDELTTIVLAEPDVVKRPKLNASSSESDASSDSGDKERKKEKKSKKVSFLR